MPPAVILLAVPSEVILHIVAGLAGLALAWTGFLTTAVGLTFVGRDREGPRQFATGLVALFLGLTLVSYALGFGASLVANTQIALVNVALLLAWLVLMAGSIRLARAHPRFASFRVRLAVNPFAVGIVVIGVIELVRGTLSPVGISVVVVSTLLLLRNLWVTLRR